MGKSAVLRIEGVGPVLIEHSKRARRMSITVRPGGVRVAVPQGVSLERGRDFALARKDWIGHHCRRMALMVRAGAASSSGLPPLTDRPAARSRIVRRLDELSARYNLPYAAVTVRNQKTRWGSCGVRKTISLNINLARLPGELMDYVIVHELFHTKVRGHGRAFWKGLERLLPRALELRRELGRYSLELMRSDE